jgi:hypothetical protein
MSRFLQQTTNETFAHLQADVAMLGDAVVTIVTGDHPPIRAINPHNRIKGIMGL